MKIIKKHKVTIKMVEDESTFIYTNSKGIRHSLPKELHEDFKEYLIKNTVANALIPYWGDGIEYEFSITVKQL